MTTLVTHCHSPSQQSRKTSTCLPSAADLRILFAGQAKLLAARAEAGLPIDVRSLLNLVRMYRKMVLEKA